MMTQRRWLTCLLTATALCSGGCQIFKVPTLPKNPVTPTATVTRVELVDVTDEGARVNIHLTMQNPNDYALPLTEAVYSVRLNDARYEGDARPNATLPKQGTQTIVLPASMAGGGLIGASGTTYEVNGSVTFVPPGEIRELMTDMGIPLPTAAFSSKGQLETPAAGP